MEKKIEKMEKTVVEEKVTWIAMDGTMFKDYDKCKEWEDDFKCMISKTFNEMERYIVDSTALGIPYSNEDNICHVVMPKNENEIVTLNYIIKNCESWGLTDGLTLNDIGKKFIFNFGYPNNECPAFRNEFVEVRDFDKTFADLKNAYEKAISVLDKTEEKEI